jgi:hypothetical protein
MGCDDCKHADWKRTKNGRLHPDKTGRCRFVWTPPPLPLAFHFSWGGRGKAPEPSGGYIERGDTRMNDCPCFEQKVA